MRAIAKRFKRDLFSLSTVLLVAIPLLMNASGKDAKDIKNYNLESLKQGVSSFFETGPVQGVFHDVTSTVQNFEPVRMGLSAIGKGGATYTVRGGGPIFLP